MRTNLESNIQLEELIYNLSDRGMSTEGMEQVESIIRSCWNKGVDVIIDPTMEGSFGSYHPTTNELTLGGNALDCNVQLIETLEHEFIHVLQDEIAGIQNSDMEALGLPTGDYGHQMVNESYGHLDHHTQALEVEAFTGEEMMDAGGFESIFL